MAFILRTLTFLAFLACTLGAPAPAHAPIQKRSFKIERVPNPQFNRSPGAGTKALVKAHRKFSVALPPGLVAAMNEAQKGQASGGVQAAGSKDEADGELSSLESALEGLLGGPAATGQPSNTAKRPKNGGGSGAAKGIPKASPGVSQGGNKGGINSGSRNGTNTGAAKGTGVQGGRPQSTGIPAAGKNSTTATGVGIVAATPEGQDTEFLSPVTIGGQTMIMDFDTGSSDLWVFNTQLSTAAQTGHQNYDPQKSQTFKMLQGQSFTISYGDGSGAAGNVGTDTVDIGGATATSQAIELATAVSDSFVQDHASNGLLGLAFSTINAVKPTKQKTFFDSVMPSLAAPVFTADLRAQAVGAYEFGRIDDTKFTGSLQWAIVNTTQGFWQFSSDQFQVGNASVMQVAGGQAIADTGTTLMLMNAAIVDAYYSQVEGATLDKTVGGFTFPCAATLPDLKVAVGQNMATVKGNVINFAPIDKAGTTCFGGVQAIAGDLQIYGDIMFKSQFVVFNGGNNTLGVAPHA